jgi:aerobic carbon-monoxide dehydrogenase medium subunit
VKPVLFEYHRADSVEDALDVLAEVGDEASVLAGGQSLIPLLNLRLARPAVVVDINRVPDLDAVAAEPTAVAVGALARARTVERSAEVASTLPVLRDAIAHIAHPQIRVRTTIGGNVAHGDPASELPAVLVALGGSVELARRDSDRTVGAADFFQDVFTTAREPDELVVGVRFPVLVGFQWRFLEVARRHGDYGMVSACVGLRVQNGSVTDARIALAGCGPIPVRPELVEKALTGAAAAPGLAQTATAAVRDAVEPSDDIHATAEYRRSLAGVLVGRAVTSILEDS